ncbi:Transcription factor BIM2 [Morella rubra]|uniref:Transcription factor BIM2 n=1 Tax=Morella rubra TaxID=262757 RepID=A0A6A1VGV3_9ROSI|nr:Transcription factor BIM2 [Morella rubra]
MPNVLFAYLASEGCALAFDFLSSFSCSQSLLFLFIFQILRNIIPQNDQKRDKASFLLEVIEYIQFLQEKLNMYEGQHRPWNLEPKKLIPWEHGKLWKFSLVPTAKHSDGRGIRNNRGPVESFAEQSQVIKNGFGLDSNVVAQASLTNAQNSPESELGTAAVYKALDQPTVSATPLAASNVQRKTNMFDPAVTAGMLAESLQESVPDAENMLSQPQSQWWHARPYATEHAVPTNTLNEQEGAVDSGSISISSVYSQEILNSLTHALQCSGVDLSQASISVQINVGKPENSGLHVAASNSKDHEKQSLNNQVMEHAAVDRCCNESDLAQKRLRTEES